MKTLNFKLPVRVSMKQIEVYLIGAIMVLAWFTLPTVIAGWDVTAGYIDQSIWLLVLLSLISFLLTVGLCWWLLQRFWVSAGLPDLNSMVLGFKGLRTWEQLGFYFACFVALLWAAVGVIVGVM
ncbi:hypothetical protein ABIE26_005314 [Pedobacter africanus]|uniref:Uncharacterized protein n=1 Tax=Pedobacter africanus TaxID=151894 RepID=A0ACC6L4S8_9SPHI|nr:hypothetical protein [Pedobacter africanus]MDR6786499.1 hypothetical protein [Pedobacter africanus]